MTSSIAIIFLALISSLTELSLAGLQVGFYSESCPRAESIVSFAVSDASAQDPGIPAALLRLHYHDCFVQGCDGSVLVSNIEEGEPERNAFGHQGLRGFEVIDAAKAKLEAVCQGIVSCADVVTLAARDSVVLSRGPHYDVPTGRRDGRVSNIADAANMPDVKDGMEVLKSKFASKGLDEKDLILLSAAHTIGSTACFFIEDRLYGFPAPGGSDPPINPKLLQKLKFSCPEGGSVNARVPLDHGSEFVFDDSILRNIRQGFGVIESDSRLYNSSRQRAIIDSYVGRKNAASVHVFFADFVDSVVKMGKVGVKVGREGEIRRRCSAFN